MRLLLLLLLAVSSNAFADGSENYGLPRATPQPTLDERLPPVLPGEIVERGGERMKVWSSSGPVTTGETQQPPQPPQPGSIGVLVDQRDRDREFDQRSGR